jgi:hypothetical protein
MRSLTVLKCRLSDVVAMNIRLDYLMNQVHVVGKRGFIPMIL